MKRIILSLAACALVVTPAQAQTRGVYRSNGAYAGGNPYVGNNPALYNNAAPYGGYGYGTGYGNPYAGNPYGSNPLMNPWVNPYGNPYAYNGSPFSSFGAPVSVGGGFYGMAANGRNFNFWKAPSGYYYPWTAGYGTGYTAPIVIMNNGSSSPTAARPPLSTMFTDTLKYLDEQKAAGKLDQASYQHLKQRALDLLSKERDLRQQGGGTLDNDQEASIRSDVDSLGGEIARSVKI